MSVVNSAENFSSTIHDYLDTLSVTNLQSLYSSPSGCLAVFRLLSPLGRQIVLSLLWMESSIRQEDLWAWISPGAKQLAEPVFDLLARRSILKETAPQKNTGKVKYAMTPTFKENMRLALTGGGNHKSFGNTNDSTDKHTKTIQELDEIAVGKWETILHFLVSKGGEVDISTNPPKGSALYLLAHSGLMSDEFGRPPLPNEINADRLSITKRGFQFLLEDVHTQQWDLMLHYLRLAPERGMNSIEALSFLFMLGSLELGKDYSVDGLSPTQLTMLDDLSETGFIYRRKKSSKRFYPTRLATSLSSGGTLRSAGAETKEAVMPAGDNKGFIIIETNFRVYAYTDNLLQLSILNLFVTFKARFPNLAIGEITRGKMRFALNQGITADQIIAYLEAHAHPQMHRNNPLLPVTVQDQLRLYERELRRIDPQEGHLYSDFASQDQYSRAVEYAKQLNVLLHQVPSKRMFFVTSDGHLAIRDYVSRLPADAMGYYGDA